MSDQLRNEFKSCLEDSCDALRQLVALLQKEKQALSNRNLDEINPTLTEKKLLITQIEALEKERHSLLSNAGFSTDKDGHIQFLSRYDDPAKSLDAAWEIFSALIHDCDQLNQENAAIAETCQNNLKQLINMLGNMFDAGGGIDGASVYSANGSTQGHSGSQREIDKA